MVLFIMDAFHRWVNYKGLPEPRPEPEYKMASVNFKVRHICSAEEVAAVILPRAVEVRWKPGALDHVSFFPTDESGFYVGELDGKVISCISVVKYSKDYAFVGLYIVDKAYRGKGYGLTTWNYSFCSVPEGCNCALGAVEEMTQKYGRYGFKPEWRVRHTTLKVSKELLQSFVPNEVVIKPAVQVPFKELLEYDTSVHVYARPSFLEKWISAPNCYSYAALNQEGQVAGYAVVWSLLKKDGWKIGPVFANDSVIAKNLYRTMIDKVAAQDPTATLTVDIPYDSGFNPDGLDIAAELSGNIEMEMVRMYTKGVPPKMPLEKIFAETTTELGWILGTRNWIVGGTIKLM